MILLPSTPKNRTCESIIKGWRQTSPSKTLKPRDQPLANHTTMSPTNPINRSAHTSSKKATSSSPTVSYLHSLCNNFRSPTCRTLRKMPRSTSVTSMKARMKIPSSACSVPTSPRLPTVLLRSGNLHRTIAGTRRSVKSLVRRNEPPDFPYFQHYLIHRPSGIWSYRGDCFVNLVCG